ncbi:MAG: response regulator [Halobacteriovoraceae bacterium]|jgi:two-component system, chemotaxis family, chemotaxis protein CheY|nr:response regulator [Halobacteriovoraceae bacterium]
MSEVLNHKIIIVEDNEFSRILVVSKLKKHGFTNLSYPESSVEAWEQIAEAQLSDEPFDLVITDLNMPDLDGMDLISKIKEDPFSESIKVMVISADADQYIIDITKSLGAVAYMTKPVVEEELVAVVEAVLLGKKIPKVKGMFAK